MTFLSDEFKDSLDGTTQVEGAIINELLKHYNPQQEVLQYDSRLESLEETLGHIDTSNIAKKTLLVVPVNALDGSLSGSNHYVGLVIDKENNVIHYIDPMGSSERGIHKDIGDRVNQVFEGWDITSYKGRLQYANAIEEGEFRHFPSDQNNHDCGPILTYLMTKAVEGNSLPSIGRFDQIKESKEIGQGLRRVFRQDDNKDEKTNISSLDVNHLRTIGQQLESGKKAIHVSEVPKDLPKQQMKSMRISGADIKRIGTSTTHSALKSKDAIIPGIKQKDKTTRIGQTVKVEDIRLERVSRNPEAINRRLDSIARIISGKSACAAVAFDGEKLLVANNDNDYSNLTKDLFLLLENVANTNMTKNEIKTHQGIQEDIVKIQEEAIKLHSLQIKGSDQRKKYINKIPEDLAKVFNSLAIDCEESKRFPESYRNAFKRGISINTDPESGGVVFVQGVEADVKAKDHGITVTRRTRVHAEMALLDRVVGEKTFVVKDEEITRGIKPFYMGITKLCCRDCSLAIRALNEDSQIKVKGSTFEFEIFQTIVATRGEHYQQFPWGQPEFFARRSQVERMYSALKNNKHLLFDPGLMLADSSAYYISNTSVGPKVSYSKKAKTIVSESTEKSETTLAPLIRGISFAGPSPNIGALSPGATPLRRSSRINNPKSKSNIPH